MKSAPILVGRHGDGARVLVTVTLRYETNKGDRQTTDHGLIVAGQEFSRLSLMGEVIPKYGRNAIAAGQIQDDVRAIANHGRPPGQRSGPTMADKLLHLWNWHLNDMRAGCVHVPEPVWDYSNRYIQADLEATPACPETGYRYGHAWLVEILPPDVEALAQSIIESHQ